MAGSLLTSSLTHSPDLHVSMAMASSSISIAAISSSSSSSSSFRYHCNKLTTRATTTTSRVRFIRASSKSFIIPSPLVPPTTPKVVPAIIVGGGKLGKALEAMGDGEDLLVKRGESVPVDFEGPIFVCTRNDDLDDVLQVTPQSRWKDLVFFQEGMIEPWLQSKGLNKADQVLAYFYVSKLGEPPIDVMIDTTLFARVKEENPQGLTAAYGKWASTVAKRLQGGGLSCKVLEYEKFELEMLEKLVYICTVRLVGARYPGATVRIVAREHSVEVSCLMAELFSAVAEVLDEGALERRLFAYLKCIAHFPAAVKEFKWTNGYFYSLSQKAVDEGKPDPCPLHTKWLKEVKIV